MAVPPKHHIQALRKKEIAKYLIMRTIGNFLVLFTIFGIAATFGPALFFEAQFKIAELLKVRYQAVSAEDSAFGKLLEQEVEGKVEPSLLNTVLSGKREEILYPKDPNFSVIIPKFGANEKITANVSPDNEEEYLRVLQNSIAHAKGTAYPGLNGTTYLFAHSTDNFWNVGRYNAVFYLLNKMEKGNDVVLFFNGKRFDYKVTETKIVDGNDTQYIDSRLGQGEKVILQTCWPPGTAWKRLLVFAEPV